MDMFYFCNIFGYSVVRGDFHFWGQNVALLDYEYCAYVCHEDNSWGGACRTVIIFTVYEKYELK